MPRLESDSGNFAQTVLKAFDVLECLAAAQRPLTAPEVARATGMSRPTAYRLLSTLESRGYVKNDEHTFALGTQILSLSQVLLESFDLPRIAYPFLRELTELSGETTYVSILDGTEILYVNTVESTQSVRSSCTIGTRNQLYASSMGKSILAYLPSEERDAILDAIEPMQAFTPNTITDRAGLMQELSRICSHGYALDNIEVEDNVRCVGAPIFDHTGYPFAAMSLSGPAYRLPVERLHELSSHLTTFTQQISRQMGYTR